MRTDAPRSLSSSFAIKHSLPLLPVVAKAVLRRKGRNEYTNDIYFPIFFKKKPNEMIVKKTSKKQTNKQEEHAHTRTRDYKGYHKYLGKSLGLDYINLAVN